MKNVTITISVNISAADMKEGNREYHVTIPENHLPYLNPDSFAREIAETIRQARVEYERRNSEAI